MSWRFALIAAAGWMTACSPAAPVVRAGPSGPSPTSANGKVLYDKYCKLCHGEGGVGYAADNATALSNQDFLRSASDPFVFTAIDRGRPGTAMAAYGAEQGGPLAHGEIRDIMLYLRGLQTEEDVRVDDVVVRGDTALGETLFRDNCARCHGDHGQGTQAISLNNPMFLASASDGYIRFAIEHGRRGTPMPAFGDKLAASDIDNLVRLIRSWARNVSDSAAAGEVPPAFEQAVVNPDGPDPELGELREGRFVPAEVVKAQLARGAKMVFLDARPTSDWLKSHIPGALPFPYYDTDKMMASLPRDGTWIIAYCACPHAASGKVMDELRAQGFPHTAIIDEGILVWTARGYPLTFGANP